MRRRKLLKVSGSVFAATGGRYPTVARQDDNEDDSTEPDPIEFTGEGATITDEFELETGPTLVEGSHGGESTFDVRIVPDESDEDYALITRVGEFEGSTGTFIEDGTYLLEVDADGPWELVVRQPRAAETEAADPPVSFEGTGTDWIGPILFDDETRVAGACEDGSVFRVELVPQNADDSEFVWGGSELIFDAIGRFLGVTDVHTDGIGYVTIDASGDWILEVE